MADRIESNIVLQTMIPNPQGEGFGRVHAYLEKLDKKLKKITETDYRIKIDLDESALNRLGVTLQRRVKKATDDATKAGGGGTAGTASGGPIGPPSPGIGGSLTQTRRTQRFTKKGIEETITGTSESSGAGVNRVVRITEDALGNVKRIEEIENNIAAKEKARDEKRIQRENAIAKRREDQARERQESRVAGSHVRSALAEQDAERRARERQEEQIARSHVKNTLGDQDAERRARERQEEQIAKAHVRDTLNAQNEARRIDAKERSAQEKQDRRVAGAHTKDSLRVIDLEAKERERQEKKVADSHRRESLRVLDETRREEERNAAFVERTHRAAGRRELRDRTRQLQADDTLQANRRTTRSALNEAVDAGFQELPSKITQNRKTGGVEEILRFRRISGNALTGYRVQLLEANIEQGKFNTSLLEGAAASRAMGDSFGHAIAKVGLWAGATTLVFAAARGIGQAAIEVANLEEATVLLARVGNNLGNNFEQRTESATRLTNAIVQQTTAIGGNATEALKAAAVFARAGQTEVQIQENVRAALLASKIAELETVEAAKLFSSAISQFGDSSVTGIQVLDQLNTLSNNYRVTTDDLLQSISRTGSVFAGHNSRLSELAATTAVTAQVTSRSGAEIGNAMKTIVSQLDRVETKRALLEKLNVSVHGVGGQSKNYTQILLELALATQKSTDAERNQISIQIAGVRQRNILLAQIRHSIELIKAENLALLGENEDAARGSATQEFLQNAGTLNSALQRMQAQAIQFSTQFGGPLKDAFKDVANILTGFLKILSSGKGVGAQLAAQIGIVSALAAGLYVLANAYQNSNLSIFTYTRALIANTTAAYQNAVAQNANRGAVVAAAIGFRTVAASALQAAGAIVAAAGPYVALAGAVYLAVGALGEYAESAQVAQEVEEARLQNIDRQVAREANRATAIRNSAQAIITIALEIERLREEERKFGVDNSKFIDSLNKQAKEIEKSSGLAGVRTGRGDVSAEGTEADRFKKEKESNQKQIDLILERLESERFITIEKENQLELAKKTERELEAIAAHNQTSGFLGAKFPRPAAFDNELKPPTVAEGLQGTFLTPGASSETRLQKQRQAIEALKKEIHDLQSSTSKAEEEISKLESKLEGYVKAARESKELNLSFNLIAKENARDRELEPVRTGLAATSTLDRQAHGLEEIDKIEKRRIESLNVVNRLLDLQIADVDQLEEAQKQLDHLTDRSLKLQIEKYQQLRSIQKSAITDQLGLRAKLNEGATGIAFAKARGLDPTASSFGDAAAENDARRQAVLNTIRQNLSIGEDIKAGRVKGTPDQLASASESIRIKTQEDLNRLKDLEVEKALILLEAEKNIALERKKSADEALRAVGALGDEDKLRVLAQAQFFAKNPGKKFSVEEQFGLSGEDNTTLQRFFGSKLEDFSSDKSKFKDFLGSAGFGVTSDIARGEAELAARRAGRTDDAVLRDAEKSAKNLVRQSGVLGGNAAQIGAIRFATGGSFGTAGVTPEGGGAVTISAEIKNSSINLEPLLASLEKSNAKLNQEAVAIVAKQFEKIVDDRIRAASRVRIAGTAPPAAAP